MEAGYNCTGVVLLWRDPITGCQGLILGGSRDRFLLVNFETPFYHEKFGYIFK